MRVSAVAVLLVLTASIPSGAQLAAPPTELGWVGFYNRDLLDWLENENRLNGLCPPSTTPADALQQCRADVLRPLTFLVPLYAGPNAAAPQRRVTAPSRRTWQGPELLLRRPGRG